MFSAGGVANWREWCQAFLHPEGAYDDPKGGALRSAIYRRLRRTFSSRMNCSYFAEVDHHDAVQHQHIWLCYNRIEISCTIANLFVPATIDACMTHAWWRSQPGIKT